MKKNVAAARGVIEPIIGVHRDDLINPLCGLKSGYPKMAFQNLVKRQSNWLEIGGLFFSATFAIIVQVIELNYYIVY